MVMSNGDGRREIREAGGEEEEATEGGIGGRAKKDDEGCVADSQ